MNQELRLQMRQFKKQQDDLKRKEADLESKLRERERDKELEQIVMKKITIEKMKQQQALIDDMLRKKESEVLTISRLQDEQAHSNAKLLRKALERAEYLQK